MIVDGRKIADEIISSLNLEGATLLAIQVGEDPATESFLRIKKKFGERAGARVLVEKFETSVETHTLISRIKKANQDKEVAGILVQLPLPERINTAEVLSAIDPNKDPDALSGAPLVLPPVVAAVAEVVSRYNIDLTSLNVAVVGYGRLVGEPVGAWLKNLGVEYAVATEETGNLSKIVSQADVVVSGAGVPGLIKPGMVKEGVVLIDAGTSESPNAPVGTGGKLAGDCDPACADKAAIFTPVPGGIGPIAVAELFANLETLIDR